MFYFNAAVNDKNTIYEYTVGFESFHLEGSLYTYRLLSPLESMLKRISLHCIFIKDTLFSSVIIVKTWFLASLKMANTLRKYIVIVFGKSFTAENFHIEDKNDGLQNDVVNLTDRLA